MTYCFPCNLKVAFFHGWVSVGAGQTDRQAGSIGTAVHTPVASTRHVIFTKIHTLHILITVVKLRHLTVHDVLIIALLLTTL